MPIVQPAFTLFLWISAAMFPHIVLSQDLVDRSRVFESTFAYVGTNSCSAASCHGSRQEVAATLGREYSIWVSEDPHSDAYATLLSPASRQIAKNLGLANAHQAKVCLDCHASDAKPDETSDLHLAAFHRYAVTDGVGCESCHGPASKWLEPHTRGDWQYLSSAQKERFGFTNTSDLLTRGKTCAECHVGSLNKDMNHDLIASGHPRLLFELSAYEALLPRHWSRAQDELNNSAALEAKLWSVGQVASLLKKLELLEKRASLSSAPWPEFGEYDCYDCHHDLRSSRLEPEGEFSDGKLVWDNWHRPAFELLLRKSLEAKFQMGDVLSRYEHLKQEMAEAVPDRDTVVSLSRLLRKDLEIAAQAVVELPWSEFDLRNNLRELTTVDPTDNNSSWDELAQRYLATAALRQALIDSHARDRSAVPSWISPTQEGLAQIRDELFFKPSYNSPASFHRQQKARISESFWQIKRYFELDTNTPDGGTRDIPAPQ